MLNFDILTDAREKIRQKKDIFAKSIDELYKKNNYFNNHLIKALNFIIPQGSSILHVGCRSGYILQQLQPSKGLGIEYSDKLIEIARAKKITNVDFKADNLESFNTNEKFDYIIISSLESIVDLRAVIQQAYKSSQAHTRIILINSNKLWRPLAKAAEFLRLKSTHLFYAWLDQKDITDILLSANCELLSTRKAIIMPFYLPLISNLLNRFFVHIPFINWFNTVTITLARPLIRKKSDQYSVSVVIPCRNEIGNIENAVKRIPPLGKHTEIIFGDDKSTDGTPDKVREMIKNYPDKDIKLVNSPGICKADNVWTCFDNATGDILMILDADLTVIPEELPPFYEAIANDIGEYINGSRLIYPMGEKAMPFINVIGNKFFSHLFSYILNTPIKDTLCGTKVLWRKDFEKIKKDRGIWGIKDRWGDYEIIFGAAKHNLKIVELPVHYQDRTHGETKMTNRLKNGLIMLKMSLATMFKYKFHK